MSDEQLAEIAARAKAATAGTWHLRPGGAYGADTLLAIVDDNEIVVCTLDFSGSGSGARLADRSFIVQAHRDVPALLARIAELEAERDAVRGEVADAVMCTDDECLNRHHPPKIAGLLGGVGLVDAPDAGGPRG